jgi:hypothetical protein
MAHQHNLRLWTVGATGALLGTAVNLAIYGIGRAAGIEYVVDDGSSIAAIHVISLSLITFAAGVIAAAVASHWRNGFRVAQIAGGVFAVLSTFGDFTIDGSAAAMLTLALMHLALGTVYFATIEFVSRDIQVTNLLAEA